jgi:hypothetical protein
MYFGFQEQIRINHNLYLKAEGWLYRRMLVLENDAVSSVYDMAGDDKERVAYDVGIYT